MNLDDLKVDKQTQCIYVKGDYVKRQCGNNTNTVLTRVWNIINVDVAQDYIAHLVIHAVFVK